MRAVVIGAGVGGLTTAAVLARAGLDVTVLEAHVYPGGCAGTFYHKGYRFDAGATLAGGFYPGGPMDLVAQAAGIDGWPVRPSAVPMAVHMPDGATVTRRGDAERWFERRTAFGPAGEGFWRWQERTADALWDLALRTPPWPPQSGREALAVARAGLRWMASDGRWRRSPRLAADALRPVSAYLSDADDLLRLFVDAQLLISAQATSERVNALYGASALDLPRRGVVHVSGGMGAIAETLADAVRSHGGHVLHKHEATRITVEGGCPVAVEAKRRSFPADVVVANLPPANVARLLGQDAPRALRGSPVHPRDGWGAFTVHVGVDAPVVPPDGPLHHQVIAPDVLDGAPMGEGNTVFLSLSPAWDEGRAPDGRRALTISTHTALGPWWKLLETDRAAYDRRKGEWAERTLATAERALPGLRDGAHVVLPGTPVTFQRFTRRRRGWVGGYPQTHLLRTHAPRLAPGLWMVGDSIFPGQSTAAVALGGLRVASGVLDRAGATRPVPARRAHIATARG